MASRTDLHQILVDILGTSYVYYQPPESLKLNYPCIMYSLSDEWKIKASNADYSVKKRYMVTIMDKNPDSLIPEKMRSIPYCSFDRSYVADNINHFVYTIYF